MLFKMDLMVKYFQIGYRELYIQHICFTLSCFQECAFLKPENCILFNHTTAYVYICMLPPRGLSPVPKGPCSTTTKNFLAPRACSADLAACSLRIVRAELFFLVVCENNCVIG